LGFCCCSSSLVESTRARTWLVSGFLVSRNYRPLTDPPTRTPTNTPTRTLTNPPTRAPTSRPTRQRENSLAARMTSKRERFLGASRTIKQDRERDGRKIFGQKIKLKSLGESLDALLPMSLVAQKRSWTCFCRTSRRLWDETYVAIHIQYSGVSGCFYHTTKL
jgi:hypothetical protein